MKKRGQITLFFILALSLVMIFGLAYYLGGYKKTETVKVQAQSANQNSDEAAFVKSFVENCIKSSAEDALFTKIGKQGGFINPAGDARYTEQGAASSSINPKTINFYGNIVPYYYAVKCELPCTREFTPPCVPVVVNNVPSLDSGGAPVMFCPPPDCVEWTCTCDEKQYFPDTSQNLGIIGAKLKHYVEAEFDSCFNTNVFKSVGVDVTRTAGIRANAEVSLNAEDVAIKLNYPLTIKKGQAESKLESFIVVLPIRIKALYDSSMVFVTQVKNKVGEINHHTYGNYNPSDCTTEYTLGPQPCQNSPKYDKNRLTNVYLKGMSQPDGNVHQIVQFVDFSTYEEKYFTSYLFQFAVKTKNVNINGACAG